ncbi:MAG: hypothetical protein QOJ82_3606 [Solirubrobacteraceae bacterium]|jgi:hypothetical protein|nr:hypothetical protein [Solirubrobacteraceae bacterium]
MRRTCAGAVAALAAVALATGPAAGSTRSSHAHLRLVDSAPATVRGTGFHHGEHVKVVVRQGLRDVSVRRVIASRAGTFTATFPGIEFGACDAFTISALGALGTHVTMHRLVPLHAC